ncbi:MAG TPA: UDP-N-acetylmuramoyl-L-alanyl-D-glutamate--2,6-diaminopimelate ligase [Acidobacteriaceae bacterium]|nr:UDP-N-acetylmuramoyl-L-alanyl-D-glutamate--2,6-diaminopimelate ligase [Acidobacteriaceae bacterium]
MQFDSILDGIEFLRRAGPSSSVSGVEYDSRRVGTGSLFVAMQGGRTDGNRYIAQAVERGASAIVTDSGAAFDRASRDYPQTALVETAHGRQALSLLSSNFFAHPERQLKLSGITGTNGKTTTAFLLEAMLQSAGRSTVLAGTIEYHVAGQVRPAPHTTPESRDLLELFREGVDAGASEAVMEVSSHALDQGRVFGLCFDVAIFTNLTRDHLDYHGSMEAYFAAKRRLFDGSQGPPSRAAVLNSDDEHGRELRAVAISAGSEAVFTYGLQKADFRAEEVEMSASGMRFAIVTPFGNTRIETRLTGRVNVYNLLAASAAASARGLTLSQIAAGAQGLTGVPGRFESIACGQKFAVIVDYAHTDDALTNVLTAARDFVKTTGGRVITLFGCGGDRDRSKRPLMGHAAGAASDVVVLTSDNPRSEDPQAILDDVLAGLRGARAAVLVEPDRERAIHMAIATARPGDLVLLAGKGHEKTQTFADRVIPFDDAAVACAALSALDH